MHTDRFNVRRVWAACLAGSLLVAAGAGCSATPIGMAMTVAGDAIDDADEQERSKQLLGKSPAAADAAFGQPLDVLSDVNSNHTWGVYPVPNDVMNNHRYVLEAAGGKIVAVDKIEIPANPIQYDAILMTLKPKVIGKTPEQCEKNLNMGAPKLTLRSRATGQIIQLYDATLLKGIESPHYCVLRFGTAELCEKVDLVKMYTSGPSGISK